MYNEIMDNLEKQLDTKTLENIKNKTVHLGIFSEPYLTYMLEGKKTIESRFSKNRILPYEKITKDNIVIVKKSSGSVLAYFTIKDVIFYNLKETPIEDIRKAYQKALCVDESFWFSKKFSNYASLIFIDELVKLTPFSVAKKGMQTWIKLEKGV